MQIVPGIYQIGGSLNGVTWCGGYGNYEDANTYAVQTEEGLILFDSGNGRTLPQLLNNLARWDLDPGRIRACFLTHAHLDHAGGAAALAARGIPLYAHRMAAEAMAAGDERCAGYLYHQPFPCCTVDYPLSGGETLNLAGLTLEALPFPGHTAGCMAYRFLYGGQRILVSGDILGTLLDGYFGWDGSFDFDRTLYLDSLTRLARLDTDLMLPGHGMAYFGQPRSRVEDALNQALCQWRR